MKKEKFTFLDGPMQGCAPANGLSVDASLIGLEPVAGDKRFTMTWDRTRTGGQLVRATYKFVRQESGAVVAVHEPDPVAVEPPVEEPHG